MTTQRLLFKLSLAEGILNDPDHHSAGQLRAARALKRKMQDKLDKLRSIKPAGNPLGLRCRSITGRKH